MSQRKPTVAVLLFQAIARTLRCRRDQRLLAAMSERELQDLGVGRSQIPGLLRGLPRQGGCTIR
ncbi:DUF1127 domain-containing protein [Variovorax sp. PBL-E5]|uniref:DUF1127 domain-containing protein n=1 Tax=Variovorax sp. PBL-E5 TaxID=434014 RepID=UPI001318D1D1|nr:DUF1127 domain-containing protein [Variovorax sp. PBL-E5]VTU16495.1 hypothetical protein E5CHR_00147 [Variovorax sp. PBL-E5]